METTGAQRGLSASTRSHSQLEAPSRVFNVKGEGQAQSKTIGGKQKDPAVMATVGSGGGASTAS